MKKGKVTKLRNQKGLVLVVLCARPFPCVKTD